MQQSVDRFDQLFIEEVTTCNEPSYLGVSGLWLSGHIYKVLTENTLSLKEKDLFYSVTVFLWNQKQLSFPTTSSTDKL